MRVNYKNVTSFVSEEQIKSKDFKKKVKYE